MRKLGIIVSVVLGVTVVLGVIAGIYFFLHAKSPETVVAATEEKVDKIESLNFTMKQTVLAGDKKTTSDFSGDVVLPDKVHMSGEITSEGSQMKIEEIMISDRFYIKMPIFQDKWVMVPLDGQDLTEGLSGGVDPSDSLEYLKANTEVKDLGDEDVNGKDCYHYAIEIDEKELVSQLTKGEDDSSTEKLIKEMYEDAEVDLEIWIGKSDNLPYKQRIKMELKNPDKMTTDTTIELADFNKDVKIEAPKDAKEFDINDMMKSFEGFEIPEDPSNFDMPTEEEILKDIEESPLEVPEGFN